MDSEKILEIFETEKPQNHTESKQSSENAIGIAEQELCKTTDDKNKIKIVCKLIKKMQKVTEDRNVSIENLIAAAEEKGILNAMEIVQKLKREGDLFEPNPGWFRKI